MRLSPFGSKSLTHEDLTVQAFSHTLRPDTTFVAASAYAGLKYGFNSCIKVVIWDA